MRTWLYTLLFIFVTSAATAASTSYTVDGNLQHDNGESHAGGNGTGSTQAGDYMDTLLADYTAARASLVGSFQKQSSFAVVFVCFEREDIVRSTFSALLLSEGIEEYDLIVSQDGGSSFTLNAAVPESINFVYIRHHENLCTGLHHHFIKAFAFDIMKYEGILVVEEDNRVHPQAIKMLAKMLEQSVDEPDVGLVSITDLDNSVLLNASRFSAAYTRSDIHNGHLWAFGVHASRYRAVSKDLQDYYAILRRYPYSSKHDPPMRDDIVALFAAKGFPPDIPLSQDSFFVNALSKAGFTKRFLSLFRLYEPVGWKGLHSVFEPDTYYALYGHGMYHGRLTTEPFEATRNPSDVAQIKADCMKRVTVLYQKYLLRDPDRHAVYSAMTGLLTGRMNAVEMLTSMTRSLEFFMKMKQWIMGVVSNQTAMAAIRAGRP